MYAHSPLAMSPPVMGMDADAIGEDDEDADLQQSGGAPKLKLNLKRT